MKKFYTVYVTLTYQVEAESEDEALEIVEEGTDLQPHYREVEVMD